MEKNLFDTIFNFLIKVKTVLPNKQSYACKIKSNGFIWNLPAVDIITFNLVMNMNTRNWCFTNKIVLREREKKINIITTFWK